MKIKLTVSYDGTDYNGWQVQPNGKTVQEMLELAVLEVTGERVRVTGSGRTDAGVHAKGQVAHFTTQKQNIPPERFVMALNAHLPQDVRVLKSEQVAELFDACRGAKKKTYKYSLYVSQVELPLKERYAVRCDEVDVKAMQDCAKAFVGEHDFKGFCASGSSAKTTVRTIYDLNVDFNGLDLTFTITGNGFLYNMVRIIVGTLLKVGEGKMSKTELENMLESGERALGGKTLSAKGLCLEKVEYN